MSIILICFLRITLLGNIINLTRFVNSFPPVRATIFLVNAIEGAFHMHSASLPGGLFAVLAIDLLTHGTKWWCRLIWNCSYATLRRPNYFCVNWWKMELRLRGERGGQSVTLGTQWNKSRMTCPSRLFSRDNNPSPSSSRCPNSWGVDILWFGNLYKTKTEFFSRTDYW